MSFNFRNLLTLRPLERKNSICPAQGQVVLKIQKTLIRVFLIFRYTE